MEELDKGIKKAGASKYGKMARAFLIALYYTGARPIELLQLKPSDFKKDKTYMVIKIPTAKKGRTRLVSIPMSRKYATELWKYATSLFDEIYIFHSLASRRTREYETKKGIKIINVVITDRVYYYINRWTGLNPYFFRHSRMTSLMQDGATLLELQQFKGSKSADSVMPYLHSSGDMSKKIGRRLK